MALVTVPTRRIHILLLAAAGANLVKHTLGPLVILLEVRRNAPAVPLRIALVIAPVRAVHGLSTPSGILE